MHTTKYLYGIDAKELEDKFYKEALQYKYDASTKLYRDLYLKHDKTKEDNDRMFWVNKAQTHTKKLLEELE